MINNIWICLFLVVVHFIADFMLQTDQMAKRKSTSNYYLAMHVSAYSIFTFIAWVVGFKLFGIQFSKETISLSVLLIFWLHFITDYVTSRITGYYWKKQASHNFFCVIGIDQVAHYFQLFLIYNYIILQN